MNHAGNLLGQTLLQRTQVGGSLLFSHQSLDSRLVEIREDLDVFGCICIAHIEPELIELIG